MTLSTHDAFLLAVTFAALGVLAGWVLGYAHRGLIGWGRRKAAVLAVRRRIRKRHRYQGTHSLRQARA